MNDSNMCIIGCPSRSMWPISKKNSKASGWKLQLSLFLSLKFVTHDPEWRLMGWRGGKTKRNNATSISLKKTSTGEKARKKYRKISALTETFPFDSVRCVVQWSLGEFLRGLHGNRSSGTQEIQQWDQVACSQSKTIEVNNSHFPHRKGRKCSHSWKLFP